MVSAPDTGRKENAREENKGRFHQAGTDSRNPGSQATEQV